MFYNIDKALKTRMTGFQLTNESGVLTTVPVVIKLPEEEFKITQLPAISISLLDPRYAPERQDWNDRYTVNETNGTARRTNALTPFDIIYQIGLHTKYEVDDRTLLESVISRIGMRGYLDTVDDSYDMFVTNVAEADLGGDVRIFRKFITVLVAGYFEYTEYTVIKTVLERVLILRQITSTYGDGSYGTIVFGS
jgi:hypothetical protein